MSSELSVSETTPLRRPESQSSETSPTSNVNLDITNVTVNPNVNINHQYGINSHQRNRINKNTIPGATSVTVVAVANQNNNVEIRLNGCGGHSEHGDHMKMDTNRRIMCRVGLDVLILLCVGFPILGFYLWGAPYKRGFFCDDESLMHPFHESTVRNWMLYFIGILLPVGIMVAVEVTISNNNARRGGSSSSSTTARHFPFMDFEVPDWLVELYKKVGIFVFGAAVSQLTTDIAKYTIGRLRPHFFAVCQPIMHDGTTCANASNVGRYIEDFTCLGHGSTPRMLKEVRLSFPSGHSSFSFFTMVYVAIYLQSRMQWRGSRLLRHFLQFMFIMIAWYIALSRVSDYKHHWSDVLSGATIGSLSAIVVANYVSDLFKQRNRKSSTLPTTRQDLPPQTITNGH